MICRYSSLRAGLALTAIAAGVLPANARAADQQWWVRKGVGVAQITTDNAAQSRHDRRFESSTAVTPSLSIGHLGPRLDATLNYAPTLRYYWDDSDPGLAHSLLLDGKAIAVRNRAEIDFSGAVYEIANSTGSFLPAAPATRDNDVRTVQAYTLTPRLLGRFGTRTDAMIEYGLTYYDDGQENGSSSQLTNRSDDDGFGQRILGRVDNFRTYRRFGWGVTGSYEDAPDLEEWLGELDLAYRANRRLTLLATLGAQEVDGLGLEQGWKPVWALGFSAQPGARTQLAASYGRRYDHDAVDASASYQLSPLSRLTVRYSESVVTARRTALERLTEMNGIASTGTFVDRFTAQPFSGGSDPFGNNDAVFDRKRLAFTASVDGRRNDVTATLYGEEREFVDSPQDESAIGLAADLRHEVNDRLVLGILGQAERVRSDLTASEDVLFSFGPRAEYRLSERATLTAAIIHRERRSDDDIRDFTENVAMIGVRFTL